MNKHINFKVNVRLSAGFTLIEISIALVVLAVAAVGVAKVIASAYQQLAITEQYQRAYYRADSHLRILASQRLHSGQTQGVYNDGGQPGLPWVLNLDRLSDNDMPEVNNKVSDRVFAFRAELTVVLPEFGRDVRLSTLLYTAPNEPDNNQLGSESLNELLIRELQ